MKRILLCCGSGIVTSTAVANKVRTALEERGHKGDFNITQCRASEVATKSVDYDICVSTTVLGGDCHCPLVIGTKYLIGVGTEPITDEIEKTLWGK